MSIGLTSISMLFMYLIALILVRNVAAFPSQYKHIFGRQRHRHSYLQPVRHNYYHLRDSITSSSLRAAEIHTAYEYIARQRGSPTTDCITWMDPSEHIVPDLPKRQMGFDITIGTKDDDQDSTSARNGDSNDSNSNNNSNTNPPENARPHLRLPVYPLGAVHLPSDATHKLHNTQLKNIRMARDLRSRVWNVRLTDLFHDVSVSNSDNDGENLTTKNAATSTSTTSASSSYEDKNNDQDDNDNNDDDDDHHMTKSRQCFVLTLLAQDTHRFANIGTLVEVVTMEETLSNYDQSVMRIVVECKALGTVQIHGFEKTGVKAKDEYLVGDVSLLEDVTTYEYQGQGQGQQEHPSSEQNDKAKDALMNGGKGKDEIINRIVQDYAAVRGMYTHKDGVASGELAPWARDAVQANLPTYTKEDFMSKREFWNIADSWQMLCNTVTVSRRSDLQTEMNEIMVEAASKQKGPLKLPIKREKLPDDVQALLRKMEQETSEDFISCGLDSCLDFQVLMGMMGDGSGSGNGNGDDVNGDDNVHMERLGFLRGMIQREKCRLEAKQRLKTMFEGFNIGNSTSTSSFGGGSGSGGGGQDGGGDYFA